MAYKINCPHCNGELILRSKDKQLIAEAGTAPAAPQKDPDDLENDLIDELVGGEDESPN